MLTNFMEESMHVSSQQSTQILMQTEHMTHNSSLIAKNMKDGRIATILIRISSEEKTIPIIRGKCETFGRKTACDQVVSHSSVSNEHFTIYSIVFDESSVPLIYCLDRSRNGTFHNGRIIGKGNSVLLSDGDKIEIRHACLVMFYQPSELRVHDSILEEDRRFMKNYDVSGRVIGKGTFGKVFVAVDKRSYRQIACKIISTEGSTSRLLKARTEVTILKSLCHPNIVTVHDTCMIRDRIYIFEELITGGDLFSYLAKGEALNPVPEAEALVLVFQILKALEYLHSKNVAHRDLKLDNILLVSQCPGSRVVLVDFGISKYIVGSRRMTTVIGTPEFSAPEVGFADNYLRNNRPGYDLKCDLWSLGIVLHILLTGISPFYDPSENASVIARNARECKLNFDDPTWRVISPEAKELVSRLICRDPIERYSIEECFRHSWISNHYLLLQTIYEQKIINKWQMPVQQQFDNLDSEFMEMVGEDDMEEVEATPMQRLASNEKLRLARQTR
ncbi:kinase-like domain-containing protein [Lipomyces japonicus]|uniref:kinase-like domain-containing protein n=1 Tax=Lipomyces japonicus TaxID=56871 RepID=UPI0034CE1B0B